MAEVQKSGLYKRTLQGLNFELRLDIDGNQPQNQVSMSITNQFNAHWVADLQFQGFDIWEGPIWFQHEDAKVLRVSGQIPNALRVSWRERFGLQHVTLMFMLHTRQLGGLSLQKDSDTFREVEFELDQEVGVDFPTRYDLASHDDRPAGLTGMLTLEAAYAATGWNVTEPGRYDVAVELRVPAADGHPARAVLASAGATFYVQRPDRDAERAAQDVFSDEVGRVLALGGSKVLGKAVDVIRDNAPRLGILATAALALPNTREFKRIDTTREPKIEVDEADEKEVVSLAETLIKAGPKVPVELGHVGFSRLTDLLATRSAAVARQDLARELQENLLRVMRNRGVQLPAAVVDKVRQRIANLNGHR